MECLLCKRAGIKTFNINVPYGYPENTIKEDILVFLGCEVENRLNEEDVVCNICMNLIDDIANLKRRFLEIIDTPRENRDPVKLGKYWEYFAKTARNQFDESDFDDPITPSSLTPISGGSSSRISTPSNFWYISHSKDYNQELEERCARREKIKRERCQSKSSIISSSSFGIDEEVARLFKGRKRKGRRPKSAGGLPKIITKRLRRAQSDRERSVSSLSDQSCVSYSRPKKDFRPRTPKLIFGEDKELIRPRTRSISRMLFYCPECSEDKKDLEMYTAHMIELHNRKACYRCWECGVSYMTEDHLTMHQTIHSFSTMCTICAKTYENLSALRKHTARHFQLSVPCSYCDLSFLSAYECNLHIFNRHRRKRRKFKEDRKPIRIEQTETYVKEPNVEKKSFDANYSTKNYRCLEMVLNIAERPKFQRKCYEDLDFRLRHGDGHESSGTSKDRTGLGDDLVVDQEDRDPRNTDSPSNNSSFSDTDLSESSILETYSQRKKLKYSRRSRTDRSPPDGYRDATSLGLGRLEGSRGYSPETEMCDVENRLSPPRKEAVHNRTDSLSDASEHSNSIETEFNYNDGRKLIANLESINVLSDSDPHGPHTNLDPGIGED